MGAMQINPPAPLWNHRGIIKVFFFVDSEQICHSQPVGMINVPSMGCYPRIVCQAYNSGNKPVGGAFTYDPVGDNGNGAWDTFDPAIHTIPVTVDPTPVVVGAESPVEDETELSDDVAPMSVAPPEDSPVEDRCPPTGVAKKWHKKYNMPKKNGE